MPSARFATSGRRSGSAPGRGSAGEPPRAAVHRAAASRGRRTRRACPASHRNVVARIPGREPGAVVVGAHTTPRTSRVSWAPTTAPRASPSCSSSRATCRDRSRARRWSSSFFDAEEARPGSDAASRAPAIAAAASSSLRARGAVRRARRRWAEIRAMVLFDMVGDCDLADRASRRTRSRPLRAFADAAERQTGSPAPFEGTAAAVADDHSPFERGGGPGGGPDRLRLRPRPTAGGVLAHAPGHPAARLRAQPRRGRRPGPGRAAAIR